MDIRAEGFWERSQDAFFDVRVFNPLAPSNCNQNLNATYQRHEKEKRRNYEQRIREVDHGSFTPLILAATGGMGKVCQITFKRLASMLSCKRDQPYSSTMNTIRCMISSSLLKSQIRAIRGTRSSKGRAIHCPYIF